MAKPLEDYFNEFIIERSCEVSDYIFHNHKKYKTLAQETAEKISNLLALIPGKEKDMLNEYDEQKNKQNALMIELVYYQGLKDGISIKKSIDMVGKSKRISIKKNSK